MIFRFGPFELDDRRFELYRDGEVVAIQPRPFDVLVALIKNRDAVLSKDDLLRQVWPGVVVTKDALTQAMMGARKALGDAIDEPEYIQTVRGRGYRFIAEVREDGGPSRPSATSRRGTSPPFVGRAEVLAGMRDMLDEARRGTGRLVFVCGETGAGKTRLLEEIAVLPGPLSIAVSCAVDESAPELWPIVTIARELRREGASVEPDLAALADGALEVDAADVKRRFRLLDRAALALTNVAGDATLLLSLDDLHLADRSILTFVELLAKRVRRSRVLVVCAYRSPPSRDPAFEAALFALANEPRALRVTVPLFTRQEVALYVERAVGSPPSEALLERLLDKTRGNPLFLSELVHVLRAEERLRPDIATSALVGGDGLRGAIAQHLASLPETVRRVLSVAAIFGKTFPVAPLAAALDTSNERVVCSLDAAAVARIVARAGAGEYRFTYPLVRDVLYKALSAQERARLHGTAASVLGQRLCGSGAHEQVAEIAAHLVESAAGGGDVDGAVDWSLRAAALARDAGDCDAAARYARRGLDALRFAQRPDPGRRDRLRPLAGEA